MHHSIFFWTSVCPIVILSVCTARALLGSQAGDFAFYAGSMTATSNFSPSSQANFFRIVAYTTEAVVPNFIPYNQLTTINYAFLIPNGDGTFASLTNSWKLQQIVADAHSNNVRVLISVGGWGTDQQFEQLASDLKLRSAFVANLSAFVNQYQLDGADIDWEYPQPGQSSQSFLALMKELRMVFNGKLLTAAVVAYGDENGLGVPRDVFPVLDFVNVMAYDGPDHGSVAQYNRALNYWRGCGLSSEKIVMGVPFYSRPGEVPFSKLVASNGDAAQMDSFNYFGALEHYNGIPTIRAKARIALQQAGGIMFWNLDDDSLGDLSLVKTMYQAVHDP